MAQEYDKITKYLFSDYATEISQFILGIRNVEVIDNIDTEQQIVIGQKTDSVKRIRINDTEVILHIELQLSDSTHKPMWARNAAYLRIPDRQTSNTCLFQCNLFSSELRKK